MHDVIPPGSTLGVLGGGQLGRMFIQAAHAAGYQAAVLCPDVDSPAGQVADRVEQADYDDVNASTRFAASVAAVTYEFENVPAATAQACMDQGPVRPGPDVLAVCQDRAAEKQFLASIGVPLPAFAVVETQDDLDHAVENVGLPAVLKSAAGGYDGKGQRVIRRPEDRLYAWGDLGRPRCTLEAFVSFDLELSMLVARGIDGSVETFGPIANTHRNHILDLSVYPAACGAAAAEQASSLAKTIAERLQLVGVLAVELFHTPQGDLYVNELAPGLTTQATSPSKPAARANSTNKSPPSPAKPSSPSPPGPAEPPWSTCWVTSGTPENPTGPPPTPPPT